MFKHLVSELKEALVCLQAGQVTLGYPFLPHSPAANFRGKVVVDPQRCIGCGACAMACPAKLITLRDETAYRIVEYALQRCTYCAQCRDACPQKAIVLSTQFETASPSMDDLKIRLELKLVRCKNCGAAIGTRRELDLLTNQLIAACHFTPATLGWLELCTACKRQVVLDTPVFTVVVAQ